MLMGKFQNSIDAKSRMIVPAKFREQLGYKYIYPMAEWEKFMNKLSALPMSDANARAFIRHFYANAVESEIDKQGRITLPADLREYANIDKELVTIGNLDKIEVWSKEEWDSKDNMTQLSPAEVSQKMVEYGI